MDDCPHRSINGIWNDHTTELLRFCCDKVFWAPEFGRDRFYFIVEVLLTKLVSEHTPRVSRSAGHENYFEVPSGVAGPPPPHPRNQDGCPITDTEGSLKPMIKHKYLLRACIDLVDTGAHINPFCFQLRPLADERHYDFVDRLFAD